MLLTNPTTLSLNDIDCWWTFKAAVLSSLDALCCIPCCCFCGGCCGRYNPFIMQLSNDTLKPGIERCQVICATQLFAAIIVPFSGCLCCCGCCGIGSSCAKGIAACVLNVESTSTAAPLPMTISDRSTQVPPIIY